MLVKEKSVSSNGVSLSIFATLQGRPRVWNNWSTQNKLSGMFIGFLSQFILFVHFCSYYLLLVCFDFYFCGFVCVCACVHKCVSFVFGLFVCSFNERESVKRAHKVGWVRKIWEELWKGEMFKIYCMNYSFQ